MKSFNKIQVDNNGKRIYNKENVWYSCDNDFKGFNINDTVVYVNIEHRIITEFRFRKITSYTRCATDAEGFIEYSDPIDIISLYPISGTSNCGLFYRSTDLTIPIEIPFDLIEKKNPEHDILLSSVYLPFITQDDIWNNYIKVV